MAFDTAKNIRDRSLEKTGVWMDWDDETRFLVARKTNPKYKAAFSKGYRENERTLESKTNTKHADEIADQLMLDCLAEFILVGWEGVLKKGKVLAYSVEEAKKMLEEHDDLRRMVDEFSENRSNYLAEIDQRDADNLEK